MTALLTRIAGGLLALGLLASAGCTTTPPTSSAAPMAAVPVTAEPITTVPITTTPIAPALEQAAGSRVMVVESDPAGAIIVVDGRPVGKAPLQLKFAVTAQGFFLNYVEVRARFLNLDTAEDGQTTVVSFSPLQKVPAKVRITPEGSHEFL